MFASYVNLLEQIPELGKPPLDVCVIRKFARANLRDRGRLIQCRGVVELFRLMVGAA